MAYGTKLGSWEAELSPKPLTAVASAAGCMGASPNVVKEFEKVGGRWEDPVEEEAPELGPELLLELKEEFSYSSSTALKFTENKSR